MSNATPAASTRPDGERAAHHTVLLVVDMISCWDFPDAQTLLPFASDVAPRIAALRRRRAAAGIPTVYCNGNRGRWRSDLRTLVEAALACAGPGAEIVRLLEPGEADYFVLKPMHSAFYGTPLEMLLAHLGANRVILTGVSSGVSWPVTGSGPQAMRWRRCAVGQAHVRSWRKSCRKCCAACRVGMWAAAGCLTARQSLRWPARLTHPLAGWSVPPARSVWSARVSLSTR